MKIEHIAIWVKDLENVKAFYIKFFNLQAGEKYTNTQTGFSSYFLTFDDGGSRIELMHRADIAKQLDTSSHEGANHFAISVGSKENVNTLTESIRADGYSVIGEPRTTGDGYYESVVTDPEGNRIEITI